jgi:hypothetical protein
MRMFAALIVRMPNTFAFVNYLVTMRGYDMILHFQVQFSLSIITKKRTMSSCCHCGVFRTGRSLTVISAYTHN